MCFSTMMSKLELLPQHYLKTNSLPYLLCSTFYFINYRNLSLFKIEGDFKYKIGPKKKKKKP